MWIPQPSRDPPASNHYTFDDVRRINHQEVYSDGGACTNQAVSFFSRIRRIDNGTQVLIMGLAALTHPPSFTWKGYWQRARRKAA